MLTSGALRPTFVVPTIRALLCRCSWRPAERLVKRLRAPGAYTLILYASIAACTES
jgi:hypothetical protein